VILMGSDYWGGPVNWMKEKMHKEHDCVDADDLNVFTVLDEPKAAVEIIVNFREGPQPSGMELPGGMKKN